MVVVLRLNHDWIGFVVVVVYGKSWSWLYMIIRGFEEKRRKMLKMVVMIAGVGHWWVNLLVLGAGESVLMLRKLGEECRGKVYLVVYIESTSAGGW